MRAENEAATKEKIFIIKELLLEGKTLEKIAKKMKDRKEYSISGFNSFMQKYSEEFKDIGFIRRKKKRK